MNATFVSNSLVIKLNLQINVCTGQINTMLILKNI